MNRLDPPMCDPSSHRTSGQRTGTVTGTLRDHSRAVRTNLSEERPREPGLALAPRGRSTRAQTTHEEKMSVETTSMPAPTISGTHADQYAR